VTETPLLDPEWLHDRTVELFESGACGVAVRRAEVSYPLRERLAAAAIQPCFAAPRWEPRFDHARQLAGPSGRFVPLRGPSHEWPRQLSATLVQQSVTPS
jgi:hypothetical protein